MLEYRDCTWHMAGLKRIYRIQYTSESDRKINDRI